MAADGLWLLRAAVPVWCGGSFAVCASEHGGGSAELFLALGLGARQALKHGLEFPGIEQFTSFRRCLEVNRFLRSVRLCITASRIKPKVMMSTRSSMINTLLHRAGILKYLVLSRSKLCIFYLLRFQGQNELFHLNEGRSPWTWISWKLCKTWRHSCQQNPHNWEWAKGGKKGCKDARLPRNPLAVWSQSLKPTQRHSSEPARKPVQKAGQCQGEPKTSLCWGKARPKCWHVGPAVASLISNRCMFFMLKEENWEREKLPALLVSGQEWLYLHLIFFCFHCTVHKQTQPYTTMAVHHRANPAEQFLCQKRDHQPCCRSGHALHRRFLWTAVCNIPTYWILAAICRCTSQGHVVENCDSFLMAKNPVNDGWTCLTALLKRYKWGLGKGSLLI